MRKSQSDITVHFPLLLTKIEFPEAVCVLQLEGGGSLRFVDLAGSERNYETRHMTAQQHRDFAEINKSLMALKVGMDGLGVWGFWGMEHWGCY